MTRLLAIHLSVEKPECSVEKREWLAGSGRNLHQPCRPQLTSCGQGVDRACQYLRRDQEHLTWPPSVSWAVLAATSPDQLGSIRCDSSCQIHHWYGGVCG
jgi:hypothetical protein